MKNKCKLCGHEWEPKIQHPLACPKCKRYDWKKEEKKKDQEGEAF